jgi:outer membrane protein TolC
VPSDPRASVARALGSRLDLENVRDRLADAERRVAVEAEGLGPQVDLVLRAQGETPSRRPFDLSGGTGRASAGLVLDLPVDRHAERTRHRAAAIALLAARRDVESLEDEVAAEVRDAHRTLEQAARSRAIQEEGARVAARRVESAGLSLRAGRAATRDVLEAQEDWNDARNALTRALVDHEVARLALARDEGTLDVAAFLGASPPVLTSPVHASPARPHPPPPVPAAVSPRTPGGAP